MTPEKYRAAFLKAGGCLLLRDDAWLAVHQTGGRTPAATAALTRIVMPHEFERFMAAHRAAVLGQRRRAPKDETPQLFEVT